VSVVVDASVAIKFVVKETDHTAAITLLRLLKAVPATWAKASVVALSEAAR
jgi:predicted nucleic acid-binding protein